MKVTENIRILQPNVDLIGWSFPEWNRRIICLPWLYPNYIKAPPSLCLFCPLPTALFQPPTTRSGFFHSHPHSFYSVFFFTQQCQKGVLSWKSTSPLGSSRLSLVRERRKLWRIRRMVYRRFRPMRILQLLLAKLSPRRGVRIQTRHQQREARGRLLTRMRVNKVPVCPWQDGSLVQSMDACVFFFLLSLKIHYVHKK